PRRNNVLRCPRHPLGLRRRDPISQPMQVTIKTPEEQAKMRTAGRLAAEVLDMIAAHVVPGVTTEELDRLCHDHIVNVQRSVPANLNYRGFPKTICTSVNHVVCHGIPNDKRLKAGDIVNIDVTVIRAGFHGDTSRMYLVGKAPAQAPRAPAPRRLDRHHQGPFPVRAVGAHRAGHRHRVRRADSSRERGAAIVARTMGASDSELLEETRPATSPAISWPLLARLPAQLAAAHEPAAWRELLRQGHEELKARFIAEEPVEHLVHARAALIDAALREAWRRHCAAQAGTLVA